MMFEGLAQWLMDLVKDPVAYLTFVFIFATLAAIILPLPVELVLVGFIFYLVDPGSDFLGLGIAGAFILIAIVMGIGKALGSWVVFVIGVKAEKLINKYMSWGWFQRLLRRVERFCVRYGYFAMFLVMCIPLMTDTVPLYIFSILNKDGEVFDRNWFVLTNFWAGISRTLVVGILAVGGVASFGYVANLM
jgi:membrane protein YqaA with SNARE-associated domain